MADELEIQLRELQLGLKAQTDNLLLRILAETERRQLTENIIGETERRLRDEQRLRQTANRRRTIRELKAKIQRLKNQLVISGGRIARLEASLTRVRATFKQSVASLLKGGLAGILADAGISGLESAIEAAIWSNVEENYDKENGRRCITNSIASMLECFGKGSWNLDRTKSRLGNRGKKQNVHDFIQEFYGLVSKFYDEVLLYDDLTTAQKPFGRAWLYTQQQFFVHLEKLVIKGTVEREDGAGLFDYFTDERDVDVCIQKRSGQPYPGN